MSNTSLANAEAAATSQQWGVMVGELCAALKTMPSLATAQKTMSLIKAAAAWHPLTQHRIYFLRSFTVEPVVPFLQAKAALHGVACDVRVGGFNTYPQELLADRSDLYAFNPHCVVLAIRTPDMLPLAWSQFEESTRDAIAAERDQALLRLRGWIAALRQRSDASLIVHDLEIPALPQSGILDSQRCLSQVAAIRRFNDDLAALLSDFQGVHILAYDNLIARHGRLSWHDEGKWLTARMPVAATAQHALADEYCRIMLPAVGCIAKAIVLDLDNTLWGGVIGEDGIDGIKLGPEYPGALFVDFQRALLACARRGILLAICSKNNESDALTAIREHPGMVLRPEHFASFRINWNDKAQNLKEIAAELNIGVDSLLFIDDNPAERARIRQHLPDAFVLDMPHSPADYSRTLWECPLIHRLALSNEDRLRTQQYAQERERRAFLEGVGTLEEFLSSLGTKLEIEPISGRTVARVAQLTQKTNQFNLTTRRYSEPMIDRISADESWRTYVVHASDRFGSHGIVGVALVRYDSAVAVIDTLLLSCRVIGRGIETALLAAILADCESAGIDTVEGDFVPTKKNAPASSFYTDHAFLPLAAPNDDGVTRYTLRVQQSKVTVPRWIHLTPLSVNEVTLD